MKEGMLGKGSTCKTRREDVWKEPITCSGWSTGWEPEHRKADRQTGNKHGWQNKLVGFVL